MLPFLRKNQDVAASGPVDHIKREHDDETEHFDSLEVAAEDLCHAIHENDYKAAAQAIRAAFDLLEGEPHEEGPHIQEE